MGTPPNRNVRTKDFRELYDRLPEEIKELARAAFRLFRQDLSHPSLRLHPLDDLKRGRHRRNSFSVAINLRYRAIYVVDGATNVWYWVGTHSDYNIFTGKK
jgi:hypothetical protein